VNRFNFNNGSTFTCDKCGAFLYDSEYGYVASCDHYKADVILRERKNAKVGKRRVKTLIA
jgi:ribosomal protein L37E